MSTANNNDEASGSSNSTNDFDYRIKAMEEQINKLTSAFTKFMKEPVNIHNDPQETIKDKNETSFDSTDIPSEYMLSDSLLEQYKDLINNQGLLDEEVCILKKNEIADMNKLFNFPSNFQVNVAPFGTPEGIVASSSVKNNDIDLLIIEKRINDSLKPLFFMSNILATEKSNVDLEMINYLVESTILLVINAQATISRVRRNNMSKEIYGSEVLLPIKIKDTPKMFDEEETERNNEAKQSLLKQNYHSKLSSKKSVNSGGNTTGNSSNGRSNNFNGSPSNVASVWKELGLPNFCQEVVNGLKIHLLPNFKPMLNPTPISIPEGPKSDCITKEVQDLLLDDAIEQVLPNRYSKLVFYF
ncbi:hypothetical protein ACTA71_006575 [Dictyostelium dimigraforme]